MYDDFRKHFIRVRRSWVRQTLFKEGVGNKAKIMVAFRAVTLRAFVKAFAHCGLASKSSPTALGAILLPVHPIVVTQADHIRHNLAVFISLYAIPD